MYYALVNGTILNGHADMRPQDGLAVLVRDGRIEDILPAERLPAGCETLDLNGAYLMPGLINLHLHVPASGKPSKKPLNYAALAKLLKFAAVRAVVMKLCEGNVRQDLLSGVTTVRAVGGLPSFDTRLRDKINAGRLSGPRILTSDYAISVPGGHMTGSVALPAGSPEEAVAMVDDLHRNHHPDLIKLMITGGVLDCTVPGEPGILKMPADYVKAACDRAHALGYKVAAHVESTEGMLVALEGGVDTLEHGGKPTDDILRMMKQNRAVLVATLSPAMPFLGLDSRFTGVTELSLINGKALFHHMVDCIRQCRAAGIPVGLGTDTGCPYTNHTDFWRELCYYRLFSGADETETLHTATLGNASVLGLADETGSVDPGKSADLLVLPANPLQDLSAVRDPSMVICRGEIIRNPRPKILPQVEEPLDTLLALFRAEAAAGRDPLGLV